MSGPDRPAATPSGIEALAKSLPFANEPYEVAVEIEHRARDLDLILRNRNDQLVALAHKHRNKETALLRVCDAVTLAEAKRIAREAIKP